MDKEAIEGLNYIARFNGVTDPSGEDVIKADARIFITTIDMDLYKLELENQKCEDS
jgi:hypothetical protein